MARMAIQNPAIKLKRINASYVVEYLAGLMRYVSIHGRYGSTIEA